MRRLFKYVKVSTQDKVKLCGQSLHFPGYYADKFYVRNHMNLWLEHRNTEEIVITHFPRSDIAIDLSGYYKSISVVWRMDNMHCDDVLALIDGILQRLKNYKRKFALSST